MSRKRNGSHVFGIVSVAYHFQSAFTPPPPVSPRAFNQFQFLDITGLAALILAVLLYIGFLFVKVKMSSPEGVGVIVGPGWPLVAISLLAFAAGFSWQYRQTR